MSRRKPELSSTEWVLMDALWTRERATATDLQGDLKQQQGWAYSTVKTMLDRLVDKGFVRARRIGNVYEYEPGVSRPKAVGRYLDDVVDRLLSGSVTPFVQHLLERRRLSPEDAADLRKMLDDYEEEEK